jgi:hypothetical protein
VANNEATTRATRHRSREGGLSDARELITLLVDYTKQETIGPLRGVGRYLGFGIAGGFLLAIGLVMLTFAGLRALQTEVDWFDGGWSFAPYFIVVAVVGLIAGLVASRISKGSLDG